jgi:hypothetical protein
MASGRFAIAAESRIRTPDRIAFVAAFRSQSEWGADGRGILSLDWHIHYRGLGLEGVTGQGLAADLAIDFAGNLWVKLEEVARVLAPLAKPGIAI